MSFDFVSLLTRKPSKILKISWGFGVRRKDSFFRCALDPFLHWTSGKIMIFLSDLLMTGKKRRKFPFILVQFTVQVQKVRDKVRRLQEVKEAWMMKSEPLSELSEPFKVIHGKEEITRHKFSHLVSHLMQFDSLQGREGVLQCGKPLTKGSFAILN